jgi:hypothetical protein
LRERVKALEEEQVRGLSELQLLRDKDVALQAASAAHEVPQRHVFLSCC